MNRLHEWAKRMAKAIADSVKEWEAKTGNICPVILPAAKIDIPMPLVKPPKNARPVTVINEKLCDDCAAALKRLTPGKRAALCMKCSQLLQSNRDKKKNAAGCEGCRYRDREMLKPCPDCVRSTQHMEDFWEADEC